jgi:hypothetical protein
MDSTPLDLDLTSMVDRPVAPSRLEESSLDSKVLTSWRRRRRRRRRASRSRPRRAPEAEPAASALSVVCCRLPAVEAAPPCAAAAGPLARSVVVGSDVDSTSMADRSAAPHAWRSPTSIRRCLHGGHPLVFILDAGAVGPCCDCRRCSLESR